MKIFGPRGSGKTTYAINLINNYLFQFFDSIYFMTSTPNQELLKYLKYGKIIKPEPIELPENTCLIIDDFLYDYKKLKPFISDICARGRHMKISLITLEQGMFNTQIFERRNSDYIVLMPTIDDQSLQYFKNQIKIPDQFLFWLKQLDHVLIDCFSIQYRFRYRLNDYYDCEKNAWEYITEPISYKPPLLSSNCQYYPKLDKKNWKNLISKLKNWNIRKIFLLGVKNA